MTKKENFAFTLWPNISRHKGNTIFVNSQKYT